MIVDASNDRAITQILESQRLFGLPPPILLSFLRLLLSHDGNLSAHTWPGTYNALAKVILSQCVTILYLYCSMLEYERLGMRSIIAEFVELLNAIVVHLPVDFSVSFSSGLYLP